MSDSEINNLITTLIRNFESKKVTGNCIIILKKALEEKEINDKIIKLEEVKKKLESRTKSCALRGEYISTKNKHGKQHKN